MAINSPKETLTLTLSMDDDSWSHLAQGLGRQTVSSVVQKGLKEIRKRPKARKEIKSWCESIRDRWKEGSLNQGNQEAKHRNQIEIQLPAADWGEAFQLVGTPGDPVNPCHLLAAVILESEAWKQSGNKNAGENSGYNEDPLISAIVVSTKLAHTKRLELTIYEITLATALAVATVFIAVAEWVTLCK